MAIDFSKVLSQLGDDAIAKSGEPVGLSRDQSLAVAHSLASHFSKGEGQAAQLAAAETGVSEQAVSTMLSKLLETGKDALLKQTGADQMIDSAKEQAKAAMANAGSEVAKSASGFLGKLFGR